MSSPARQPSYSGESVAAFPNISSLKCKVEPPIARSANRLTAFSFEFVAKPEQSANAVLHLPTAIHSGLEDVVGFAGSLVMVSDQEARLITVIIFWTGTEALHSCAQSVRRVRALLAPYLDRCLRVQNMLAHMQAQQDLPSSPELQSGESSIDTHYLASKSTADEANVCVA